jgi:hypothetical protein
MQTEPTRELVRALAHANGLDIPENRLEIVLRQYEHYLRTLEGLEALHLAREAEPAITFSLPVDGMPPASQRQRNAQER